MSVPGRTDRLDHRATAETNTAAARERPSISNAETTAGWAAVSPYPCKERGGVARSAEYSVVQEQQHVREKLEKEILKLERKRTMLVEDIEQRQNEKSTSSAFNTAQLASARQVKLVNKQEAMKKLLAYLNDYPNASFADMAEVIERSKSTASNYVLELQNTGELSKNGSGWIVKRG